jgi:surfactin synthase thioesterase subunit
MILYCFPFAGGNKNSYNHFIPYLRPGIRMVQLELPGRSSRIREPLLRGMRQMAEDLFSRIGAGLSEPYAFYGHSMGSVLAYEVANLALECGLPAPARLFVSGRRALNGAAKSRLIYGLPRDEFIEELRVLGGTPEQLLIDSDLLDFLLPVLKADFQAIELYHEDAVRIMDVPVTVFLGSHDSPSLPKAGWQEISTKRIEVIEFEGDHFFILHYAEEIARLICDRLQITRMEQLNNR